MTFKDFLTVSQIPSRPYPALRRTGGWVVCRMGRVAQGHGLRWEEGGE